MRSATGAGRVTRSYSSVPSACGASSRQPARGSRQSASRTDDLRNLAFIGNLGRSERAGITACAPAAGACVRSEEHTSELQSLMRSSYAVFCLKKTQQKKHQDNKKNRT